MKLLLTLFFATSTLFWQTAQSDPLNLPVAEALASEDRFEDDRKSDPLRRPHEVLSFFGIAPGMDILDLFSGGGYYAEILSAVVGEQGSVLAHNNEAYLKYLGEAASKRYENGRLKNVERLTAEANELDLPPAAFDAALVMLSWHDLYYEEDSWPAIDAAKFVDTLCHTIRPGGVLGVVDHAAIAGSDPRESGQTLHRIDPARIRQDLSGGCFSYEGETDVLRNPADDLSKPMFDPAVRGRTDRVVYRFRRM